MGQTKKKLNLAKNISKNLYDLKLDGKFCDVQLHLQGSVIWGHACILASASSYFMELFQTSGSQKPHVDNHWCSRQPLHIDLDKALCDIKDLCLVCITKIIDFLYLKELVVLQGHLEHFRNITRHLKVLDLITLCESKLTEGKVFKNSDYSNGDQINTDNSLSNVTRQFSAKDSLDKQYESSAKPNNYEISDINTISNITTNVSKSNQGLETSCDLQCCSDTNLKVSQKMGKNKKRLLTCCVCNYSIVSIKKMLKHIEISSHLGSVCPICLYQPKSTIGLKDHIKGHSNLLPFFCEICNKRNNFFEHHINHLKVHCRNKKFFCEVCQKSFTRHQNLMAHMETHGKKFICNKCDYITSEVNLFETHIRQHSNQNVIDGQETNPDFHCRLKMDSKDFPNKKFNCNICDEGFTQMKNLKRHMKLKHLSISSYNCPFCSYVSKRTDLFKCHMSKHHNYTPDKEREKLEKEIRKKTAKNMSDALQTSRNPFGVLVPVKLMPQNDVSTSDSFTKQPEAMIHFKTNKLSNDTVTNQREINENESLNPNRNDNLSHCDIVSMTNNHISPKKFYSDRTNEGTDLQKSNSCKETHVKGSQSSFCESTINNSENNVNSTLQCHESRALDIKDKFKETIAKETSFTHVTNNAEINVLGNNNSESTFLGMNDSLWLNEITGELISGNHLINVQLIGSENNVTTATDSTCLSLNDQISKFSFNDTSNRIPFFELEEDTPDITSNPQTPQTSLVELDDQDFLFSWDNLDNSFYSTWVLNEATGELNMVSFNIQPINTELKLSDKVDSVSSIEDDETALFLNEGTGDLSVIYFNPNKSETNFERSINDQAVQNAMETLSEHSNDECDNEDDLLNEEFLMASANFMAHEENETFLNELTGEMNITHLNCQSQMQDNQGPGSESVYLNEETGEISWNVLDVNMENELFTNSELLNCDFDDSMNCEDMEHFSTELKDISSHLSLDANSTNNWHSVDEEADILLNEFTGEFINKM